jgi:hypothetical protein
MRLNRALMLCLLLISVIPAALVNAQPAAGAQASPAAQVTGTVISSTRTTLVVRTATGDYRLFELNSSTTRPAQIPVGATVTVSSQMPDASGVAIATLVRVAAQPPPEAKPAPGQARPSPDEPVPAEVRQLERSIQRQTARYRAGVRAGVALDPELIMLGGQVLLGPFFNENVWARPNIELGFGEVTDMIALNFEAIYRVPVTQRSGRWAFFFGAGPSMNFVKLGFATEGEDPDEEFSFDDFELDVGLNLLAGVQSRGGMFLELKATAYADPAMRFIVGYSF